MRCVFTAFLVAASFPVSHAADVFVAPAGSDAADGSLGTPYQTIAKALSVAMPGGL